MSRTHKTNPFWVKMRQGHLAYRASHDHRAGDCDLPETIEEDYWRRDKHCRYEFVYTGRHTCCCPMCHGDYGWDIPPAKRGRINGKKAAREWERDYDESIEDRTLWVGADDDWFEEIERDEDRESRVIAHHYCPACYRPA